MVNASMSTIFEVRCSFVRSGNVNISNGRLRNAGNIGYGWSSRAAAYTSGTSATAYWFEFQTSAVNPSHGPNNRWNGLPLR